MSIIEMDEKRVPMMRMYLSMALPVVLSMVTAMVYNIADTWFISAAGITGLIAGVSLNAPVLTILIAFGNIFCQLILVGLTFGALPLFGYYYGGNRKEKFTELFRFCLRFV